MPEGFDRCQKQGGKIRTIKPNADTYMPICVVGGKSYRGEVHHLKKAPPGNVAKALQSRGAK